MKKVLYLLLNLILIVCMISILASTTAFAADVVMTVNGTEYYLQSTGWSNAVRLANGGTEVTVKLFADWTAGDNGFNTLLEGTKDGSLYVNRGKLTLDLNGYTIDRNANKDASSCATSVLCLEYCTFTIDDTSEAKTGKITGGYAENGGGIYANNCTLTIKNGSIIGNKATNCGGGVYVNEGSFTINNATIASNHAEGSGGAVYANTNVTMKGGIIEENYSGNEGGGIYIDFQKSITMNGGVIRNNTALSNGGGIGQYSNYREYDKLHEIYIDGGSITGNTSLNGHGGGISWWMSDLYMVDCTITGNSAPKGYGGGIYHPLMGNFMVGGTVVITDNTAFTDTANNSSNIFYASEDFGILQGTNDRRTLPALNPNSKIGLYSQEVNLSEKTKLNYSDRGTFYDSDLTSEMADCFFADEPDYIVIKEKRSNGYYDLYYAANPEPSYEGDPIFVVETMEGGRKEFYSRKSGWPYALEQSKTNDVKITLYDDWNAAVGDFNYPSYDYNGALYIPSFCEHNITIDLNGYTIDRGLTAPKRYGSVFYMDTYGSLTVTDSSEAKTGKITGGNNEYMQGTVALIGYGGAFYVDYGKLYLNGVTVTGNNATYGGAIYCDDLNDAYVYIRNDTKIYGNTSAKAGGGIYIDNGYLYLESGEIRDNEAPNGAGVYWNSRNAAYLTGGKISGNTASEHGGGIYVSDYGKVYLGGDIHIVGNKNGNMYLSEEDANIYNAAGQDGAPNKPLTGDAEIYIRAAVVEEEISGENSKFNEGDFRVMFSDSSSYFIRSAYDVNGGNHSHKLYINTWSHADARYPRVKTVSVKNSDLLAYVIFDKDSQTITLVAYNTKRNFFERIALSDLIECTYDKDTYYLYNAEFTRDLRETQEYKIMSDNGTYVMCTVNVVPEGGTWSSYQESVSNPYKATVSHGSSIKGFTNLGEAWVYAVEQSQLHPTTIKLFHDWIAPNGEFDYSDYTDEGRLYLDELTMNLTFDLNGHTISRNLTSATENGYVLYMDIYGSITIMDSSDLGLGKITGGNTDGDAGAIYVDYGELHLKSGSISGNKASENGGAIYCDDEEDALVFIEGGKISGNTASLGGAIYVYNGYLFVDGGEISGNYANGGSAIFWESRDYACLTGGKITGNTTKNQSGAIYVYKYGDIYLGGNIVIDGNTVGTSSLQSNLYIPDNSYDIYSARGQESYVPDKPLTEGAKIGISTSDFGAGTHNCISASGSKFNEGDYRYFHYDTDAFYIRADYNSAGGDNMYRLYVTDKTRFDSRFPAIESVEIKNGALLKNAVIDTEAQVITLTAYERDMDSFKNVNLDSLISYTLSGDAKDVVRSENLQDFTLPKTFRITSDTAVYIVCTVKMEWIYEDVEIRGYSLLLEGSIGVKLYASLSEYAIANLNEVKTTVEYMGETMDVSIMNAEDPDDKSLYYVQFNVAPKEMHEDITFTIDAIRTDKTVTVSVKDYVDYVNENREEYADSLYLINTMFNYGEYSRQFFLGEEITPDPDLAQIKLTLSSRFTPSKDGSVSGLNVCATSLLLESNTTIRHYFELTEGASIDNYSFTLDSAEELTPVQKGNLYYVDITDIVAHRLNEMVTLEVSCGDESLKIVYSPLSYAKLVTDNATNQGDNLVTLIKALYNYYIMSSEYAEHINSFDGVLDENEFKPEIW